MKVPEFTHAESKTTSPVIYPMAMVPREHLSDEENSQYYEEYKKLLFTSFLIDKELSEFKQQKQGLEAKLQTIERNFLSSGHEERLHESHSSQAARPKRIRRTNDMIQRDHRCHYEKCDKAYASEGSLQQHIRLKHQNKNSGPHIEEELEEGMQ